MAGPAVDLAAREITDELVLDEEPHPEAVAIMIAEGEWQGGPGRLAGGMLQRVCLGRLPGAGKAGLKAQVSRQVFHRLWQGPGPMPVVIADGAGGPDIPRCARPGCGGAGLPARDSTREGGGRCRLQGDRCRRCLARKGVGAGVIARGTGCFRKGRHRMNCRRLADAGYPIGSGAVEAANKTSISSRMKRSGRGWRRDGGQVGPHGPGTGQAGQEPAAMETAGRGQGRQ